METKYVERREIIFCSIFSSSIPKFRIKKHQNPKNIINITEVLKIQNFLFKKSKIKRFLIGSFCQLPACQISWRYLYIWHSDYDS